MIPGVRAVGISLAAALGFTVLAVAVSAGWPDRFDQWAVLHAMPWRASGPQHSSDVSMALPRFQPDAYPTHRGGALLAFVVTWPAALVPASALAALALLAVWGRRGCGTAAWGLVAFVVANLVVLLGKSEITRTHLVTVSGGFANAAGFDTSFPSGHTARALVLVGLALLLSHALAACIALWAAAAIACLELGSYHVPSDVLGGFLIGLCVSAAVAGAARRRRAQPVPAVAC